MENANRASLNFQYFFSNSNYVGNTKHCGCSVENSQVRSNQLLMNTLSALSIKIKIRFIVNNIWYLRQNKHLLKGFEACKYCLFITLTVIGRSMTKKVVDMLNRAVLTHTLVLFG